MNKPASQLNLFATEGPSQAAPITIPKSILFGTSTWTYRGWAGVVYSPAVARRGNAAEMLAEYAQHPLFRTVGIDGTFYRPYTAKQLQAFATVLPPDFRCVSKVWDLITVRVFTPKGQHDAHAGERNPDFLNAELFKRAVLDPYERAFRDHIGPFVFELQATRAADRPSIGQFTEELDRFFSALPNGVPYAVELRDAVLLTEDYFSVLRHHGVAHVYNAWTRMPTPGEQQAREGAPTAYFAVLRLLLKRGRTYEQAVRTFEPYDQLREPLPELRQDVVRVLRKTQADGRTAYVIVNNRLEGNAPGTIHALAAMLAPNDGA